jgi:hypothetical protein
MGFLDHSTSNIILDAVLTDEGRKALAAGNFSVTKFALGDDEVNYGIIKKYGIALGKEKIEKNTPVFEAFTNQSAGQKYKLVTVSNPNLIYLPKLSLSNSTTPISLKRSDVSKTVQITVNQTLLSGKMINELTDSLFYVEMNNLFIQIIGVDPEFTDIQSRALYTLNNTSVSSDGTSTLSFDISLKTNLTDDIFDLYGNPNIATYVKVTGGNSGMTLDIPVTIENNIT